MYFNGEQHKGDCFIPSVIFSLLSRCSGTINWYAWYNQDLKPYPEGISRLCLPTNLFFFLQVYKPKMFLVLGPTLTGCNCQSTVCGERLEGVVDLLCFLSSTSGWS